MQKHWVKIVAVLLMLLAIATYVLTLDESDEVAPPGTPAPVEAAP